ncbi:hypothetical protein [Aequorivita lipolytica]|uniref:Curlin n=1 Tax=Aequorivita lipolytica TaxID=153267 RepID=A0A5C6YNS0_9FLAO|nr:hypothetical protein [Aequorivita lipolytica]TXD68690.1 hypothetical protein ESV24_11030 [Aequorivita lipolytica]
MYAQAPNPSTPDVPTNAIGVPNNSPDPLANRGLSTQNGTANKVMVVQVGTQNGVWTDQDDGAGSGENLARIRQTGQIQPGVSAELNQADVYQRGSDNQSTTLQEGDANEAVTNQGATNTASADNKAWIRQGTGNQAQDNKASIRQDGDDNLGLIRQTYDSSEAKTTQVGDENKSSTVQIASPNLTDGHRAETYQNGMENESWINQQGNGAENIGDVYQNGNNNYADQQQFNTSLSGGTYNEAAVNQIVGVYDGDQLGLLGQYRAYKLGH